MGCTIPFLAKAVQNIANDWWNDLLKTGGVDQVVEVRHRRFSKTVFVINVFNDLLSNESHLDQSTGRIRERVLFSEAAKRRKHRFLLNEELEISRLGQFQCSCFEVGFRVGHK